MAPGFVPLYIPQGVLILPNDRELCRTRRTRHNRPEGDPYAPVENEASYATSTRGEWPAAWRRQAEGDDFAIYTQRQLGYLCRAKDARSGRERATDVKADDAMDSQITTSAIGRTMGAAWGSRKAADAEARFAS